MKLSIKIICNETGGYTAHCPSLPGCICKAPTREEAKQKLSDAIYGYIASVGNFVPDNVDKELVEA